MPEPLGVYFLDVGQGDCSFILPPAGAGAILFDCNDAYVAERFVIDHHITHLSAAVVSHLDVDHIRGMLPFLQGFLARKGRVDTLYLGLDAKPAERLKPICEALLDQAFQWADAGELTLCGPFREVEPKLVSRGAGWTVHVVLPSYGAHLKEIVDGQQPNRASAVLRVVHGGVAVLIGGDAPLSSWSRLEAKILKAHVFRTPHHGGEIRDEEGKGYADLYAPVAAELSVVSVGTNNRWEHPDDDHVAAAHRAGACRVLCTQLTPRCHDRPEERLETGLAQTGEVGYAYRHRVKRSEPLEVPCAGSIAVTLDGAGGYSVSPARYAWHDRFIATLDAAMCG